MSGGADADYAEGNGGVDSIRGDLALAAPSDNGGFSLPAQPVAAWKAYHATPLADLEGTGADGQDDLIGGSSLQRCRDAGDLIEGNGASDVELGDNGTLLRVVSGADGSASEAAGGRLRLRVSDEDVPGYNGTTRFCTSSAHWGRRRPACRRARSAARRCGATTVTTGPGPRRQRHAVRRGRQRRLVRRGR